MVREGIVLGHLVFERGIEVHKAKIEVIEQLPPPVNVNSTASIILHATNSLDNPATIHHHGMFFNSTSWMDGAMGVSQWYVLAFAQEML